MTMSPEAELQKGIWAQEGDGPVLKPGLTKY